MAFALQAHAQLPPECPPGAPAADDCSDACIYCDFNNYMGTTSGYTQGSAPGFCGSIENEQWLGFIAGAGSATFTATPNNCITGDGIQIALYATCTGEPVPNGCNGGQDNGGNIPVSINVSLTPGANYFLLIDGYAGDQCDFTITVSPPSAVQAPPIGNTIGNIQGPLTICPGGTATYTVPPVTNAGAYTWDVPAGWLVNGEPGPLTVVAPGGNSVQITAGPTPGSNFQICVDAANSCYPDGPSTCRTVNVVPLPPTTLQPVIVCFEEAPYTLPWGDEANTTGTYQTIYQSYQGCDSIVRMNVTVKQAINTFLPLKTMCQGDIYSVCGQDFTDPGAYSVVCESFQGCDSTINFSIQVLEPVAQINGSGVINCTTGSVLLTASPSPAVTIFNWKNLAGQILGVNNSYVVTAPGTYILTATMNGGGLQCVASDTIVITGNTTPPTLTASGGSINCANSSVQLGTTTNATNPTWSWSGPGGFVSNLANPTVSTPGTYTVTVTSASNGCTATASATVTGDYNPPVLSTTGATLSCAQVSAQISVNSTPAGSAFVWAGPNNFNANQQSPTVSAAGTYTVTVTSSVNGCTATATATVALNNTPPGANAATVGTITCPTPTVNLNGGPGTAGNTFSWSGPGGFNAATQNAIADTAGVYILTVTGTNGCTSTATTTVSGDTAAPDAGAQGGTVSCGTPVITINGTSSASGASFAWTGPGGYVSSQQNPTDVNTPGIYTLTVTALNNCTMTATTTVNGDFVNPDASATGGIITCVQSSVTINGASATPGATLEWDGPGGFTSNQPSVIVNTVGDYILTVTAPNGCTSTAVAPVTPDSNLPNATAQGGTLSCAIQSLVLDGNTTTPNAEISWSGPNNFTSQLEDPTITESGTYTLTVTNPVNGCTVQASAVVNLDDAQPGATATGGTVTCAAPSLALNANSPTGGVTYLWSGPNGFSSTLQNPSATDAGDYTVTITDPSNGCVSTALASIVADQTSPMATSSTGILTCSLTSLTLNGNATLPSTYAWTGPNGFNSNLQNPDVTEPGDYTLTATAANGCTGTVTINVAQDIVQPGASATGNTIDCNNPTVNITSSSNTGVSYNWTGPNAFNSSLQNPDVTEDGIYTVTVTGANGCTSTADAIVGLDLATATLAAVAPDFLTCSATSVNIQTTINTNTTSLQGVVWNGPSSFSSTDEDPLVTEPGVYTLTATTINGCTSTTSVTVNQNINPPNVTAVGGTLTCSITTILLEGGSTTPSATYAWTGPNSFSSSLEDPSVSEGGVYILTVTGFNGCTASLQATVQMDTLSPDLASVSSNNLDCDDLNSTLTASSQTQGVQYVWSGPSGFSANTAVTSTDEPGDYQVLATAPNGCIAVSNVTITQDIVNPSASATGGTIDCISGQAILGGSSGTAGVSYSWSGPNNFNSNQQNPVVSADGQYVLTVTGPNGCTATATADVLENTLSPQVVLSGGGTVTCDVPSVTIISDISTAGATGIWSGPNNFSSTLDSITVSEPGVYTYTVTAQNGCISAPTSTVLINVQAPQGVTAAGGLLNCSFPSINLSAGSSTTGVIYTWTGPGNFLSNLPNPAVTNPGTYNLVVTDPVNGCTSTAAVTVTQDPTVPDIAVAADSLTCTNTTVILNATSNTPDVSFNWSGPNNFSSTLEDPSTSVPGAYSVVATALSGCTATFNYTVTQNINLPGVTAQGDTLTCTLTSGQITSNSNALGVTYAWSGPAGFTSNLPNPVVTLTGTYTVVTTGTNGCTSSAVVQVAPDVNAPVVNATGGTVSCAITSVTLNASANMGVSWQWSGPGNFNSTLPNPTATQPGNYIVAATAPNGCITSFGVTVEADTENPDVDIQPADELDCTTTQVGLNATVSGTGTFTYVWTTTDGNIVSGANSLAPLVSQAGTYQLLVTNTGNGCTTIESEPVVSNDDTPNAADIQERSVRCYGDTNGSASIAGITGGTPPYLYSLDNQPFTPTSTFTSLAPGEHILVVQDANGCEYETSFEILEPEELIVNLGPDTTIHLGDEITISLNNIVNFPDRVEDLVLSPVDLPIDTAYLPTYSQRYRVTVVDSNGCKAVDDRLIIVDRTRWVYIPNIFDPSSGENNIVTVYGGPDVERVESFLIFDRWGESLSESRNFAPNDLSKGWDGTFRGQAVNPGVYVYYAEVLFKDGEVVLYKGDITVLR
ncbi:MAG: gliding motility-associated C-terminal domain-containing protein [Saprospiraceae bacterium]|nr:gliding motility-associated C-terminal domain-containing protein [Saprospiraceae bacterium]